MAGCPDLSFSNPCLTLQSTPRSDVTCGAFGTLIGFQDEWREWGAGVSTGKPTAAGSMGFNGG